MSRDTSRGVQGSSAATPALVDQRPTWLNGGVTLPQCAAIHPRGPLIIKHTQVRSIRTVFPPNLECCVLLCWSADEFALSCCAVLC